MDWEARIKIAVAVCMLAVIVVAGVVMSTRSVQAPATESPRPPVTGDVPDSPAVTQNPVEVSDAPAPAMPAPMEREGLSIGGLVVDANDQPIADARVAAYHPDRGAIDAQTNVDGAFEIWGLSAGDYRLSASKPMYNEAVLDAIPAGDRNAVLRLTETSRITGVVRDAQSGEPVTRYEIVALDTPPGDANHWRHIARDNRDPWQAVDHPEGAFELNDVPSNRTTAVGVRATGYAHTYVEVDPVAPATSQGPVVIDLPAEAYVQGSVLGPDSAAAPGAEIYAGPKADGIVLARSANDGAFEIEGLESGPIQLTAAHPNHLPATIDLNLVGGTTNAADIQLGQGGMIEGTVWLGDEPMPGVAITASRLAVPRVNVASTTDAGGRYAIAGIPSGVVTVIAELPEDASPSGERLELTQEAIVEQSATTTVDFQFPLSYSGIAGTVTVAGELPASATVKGTIVSASGDVTFSAVTDDNGVYTEEALPPGPGVLDVTAVGTDGVERKRRVEFELLENELLTVDIDFSGGTAVYGTVAGMTADQGGEVVAFPGEYTFHQIDADAFLELSRAQAANSALNEEGAYRLEGLQPGTYTIAVFVMNLSDDTGDQALDNVRADWQTVTITGDEDINVDLSLAAP